MLSGAPLRLGFVIGSACWFGSVYKFGLQAEPTWSLPLFLLVDAPPRVAIWSAFMIWFGLAYEFGLQAEPSC